MANSDRPRGARPIGTISGNSWEGNLRRYRVDGSGSDIFPGDFVKMEADGNVDVAGAGDVELLGVMVGRGNLVHPDQVSGISGHFLGNSTLDYDRQYYDASVDGSSTILVVVGSDVLYEIQEDSDGGDLALTDIGANADILATAGSDTSRQELDSSTAATSAAQLRIVDIVDRPDNEVGTNAKWVVKINESHFAKTAGV